MNKTRKFVLAVLSGVMIGIFAFGASPALAQIRELPPHPTLSPKADPLEGLSEAELAYATGFATALVTALQQLDSTAPNWRQTAADMIQSVRNAYIAENGEPPSRQTEIAAAAMGMNAFREVSKHGYSNLLDRTFAVFASGYDYRKAGLPQSVANAVGIAPYSIQPTSRDGVPPPPASTGGSSTGSGSSGGSDY